MWNSLHAALLLAAACASLTHAEQRSCFTHETCVVLSKCPELSKLLANNRRPSSSDQKRLRDAHCGFQGDKAKVCCPLLPTDKECGPNHAGDKIINGNNTQVMEFPWAVRLGYRDRSRVSYQCGGALISSRYVLTAAHCTEKQPVKVRLGEHDARTDVDCSLIGNSKVCAPPVQDVDVEEVVPHPEYVKQANRPDGLWNDIALLRLARPVAFSNAIRPVCLPINLPSENAELLKREMVQYVFTVVGWGKIGKEWDADESDVLLKLILRTMKHSECADKYRRYVSKLNEERQICGIGKHGQDVCRGDSGGPLSSVMILANGKVRAVLRGVVSYGPQECATNNVPAIFTRVKYYMPWIMRQMRP